MKPQIDRLLIACRTGRIPADLAAWLSAGLERWVEAEGRRSLCECLDLLPDRRRERSWRNSRLRLAACALAPRASPWQQAEALARALDRFDRAWPRIRSGHRKPINLVEQLLCDMMTDAERYGLSIPRSTRRLYDVLVEHGRY